MEKEFTDALYELFVKQKLSLSNSLLIMSKKPKRDAVKLAAFSIYYSLEGGSLFSNALKTCSAIKFDDVYVSFIRLAEKNGDLQSTISYLDQKLIRQKEERKKMIGASVYPCFVIFLSIAACIFIGLYTDTGDFYLLSKFIFTFLCICAAVFYLILKMLEEDKLCEAFTAVDFLMKNGIELSEAIACAVQLAGPSCNIGRIFERARIKLTYGMDLRSAFDCKTNKQFSELFYYADLGGGQGDNQLDLFERISSRLKAQNDRRRNLCLSLIEPVFILLAGGFILMLLMTFLMPLINNVSWI